MTNEVIVRWITSKTQTCIRDPGGIVDECWKKTEVDRHMGWEATP